ncbi:alpha-ketoacid dehydrogenase subunit beta [Bradyrhizobium diazoefficiens]|uniref:alpha-ketoacid dehydrogenase subunit beta n=1 Tax=Bradyrhizobium diazoefficiens TaxID=1355477 RepID=UPI001B8BD819|nr:transketolase C-terminal domain-containing protein [Bradyrhizobium diazoefficiens]MBR0863506.1 alpha-ketoacid dehydrogenase subunit beta [Bradyrhizobium diazoefficiens]MBR0888191.1 alpha-ketoacid dehydrogenase subunit beta [Bradyrhizobium diazoefficiens]MBR0919832.1 alpha-ketoacid dehydrogenase subunit beta [Bradyrhizobium diazoefficiens]
MTSKKYMVQAINDALFEEMERDENIIVIGEDVELAIMGDTRGLVAKFGRDRIRNTPICEASLTAMALGATAAGYHVVLHMMFANFVYTGFDAIANQISKMRLMTGGQIDIPVTFLACYGGGGSNAAQHSDSAHPALMNLGGINVAMPSNAADAKGLLKTALRSRNPSFFLEAAARGGQIGEVPDGEHLVPFGRAAIAREGRDVTIVSFGSAMKWSLDAAESLAKSDIEAEIVDLRTVVPIDEDAILRSIAKTGRLVVVDEGRDRCGAGSHIAAIAADKGFSSLKAPVKRVNIPNVAIPYAPAAELAVLPTADKVEAAVKSLLA